MCSCHVHALLYPVHACFPVACQPLHPNSHTCSYSSPGCPMTQHVLTQPALSSLHLSVNPLHTALPFPLPTAHTPGLAVTWLGTSSGSPTPGRNVSCTLVRMPEAVYMVDCGEGTHRQLIPTQVNTSQIERCVMGSTSDVLLAGWSEVGAGCSGR